MCPADASIKSTCTHSQLSADELEEPAELLEESLEESLEEPTGPGPGELLEEPDEDPGAGGSPPTTRNPSESMYTTWSPSVSELALI